MVAGVGWLTPAFVLGLASHGRLLWMFWQHETHSPVGKAVRLGQGGFVLPVSPADHNAPEAERLVTLMAATHLHKPS